MGPESTLIDGVLFAVISSHWKLQRVAAIIARHYESGRSMLEIAKSFDFPPLAMFRAILSREPGAVAR